jgi:VanZ family protein
MLLTAAIPMKTSNNRAPFWAAMEPSLQNLLHIPMFAGFVLLFDRSLGAPLAYRTTGLGFVLAGALTLGIIMEGVQVIVPGRYFGWGDMALNLLGAAAGVLLVLRLRRRRARPGRSADV